MRLFTHLENKLTLDTVLPRRIDYWPVVHPNLTGVTFDGANNQPAVQDTQEMMRYDRIMVRGFQPNDAMLQGTDAINTWGLRPSDHYGVCVMIEASQDLIGKQCETFPFRKIFSSLLLH